MRLSWEEIPLNLLGNHCLIGEQLSLLEIHPIKRKVVKLFTV